MTSPIKLLLSLLVLCAVERASADEMYLTKDAALERVLGKECVPRYHAEALREDILQHLDDAGVAPEGREQVHLFLCANPQATAGGAIIDAQIGKHLPITFITGFERDGSVRQVEIMIYREEIGWQIKDPGFLEQFKGRTVNDDLRIGRTLKNITGATLSAQAVAKGVTRDLLLYDYYGSAAHGSINPASP